jgi:hypothetical protein
MLTATTTLWLAGRHMESPHADELGVPRTVRSDRKPCGDMPASGRVDQLDESARTAALKLLAILIARMLAGKPAPEASHE